VHAAGFRGIAPDLRGFGGTDAPPSTAEYSVEKRTGDMASLLDHLGLETAQFVGHDHGALTGWYLAMLRPEIVESYFAMSVPMRADRARFPMLKMARMLKFGDETKEDSVYGWGHLTPWAPRPTQFMYMLHHQLADSGCHYAEDTRAAQLALQFGSQEDAEPPLFPPAGMSGDAVEWGPLYHDGVPVPFWKRVPQPTKLAPWVTEAEVAYVCGQYASPGAWDGGMHWYRIIDQDHADTPELAGDRRKLEMPVGFLAGTEDMVITRMFGGVEAVKKELAGVSAAPDVTFLEGAGHWIQQERPDETNAALLSFLEANRDT